jgi:hypothetical protein
MILIIIGVAVGIMGIRQWIWWRFLDRMERELDGCMEVVTHDYV